jgi:predicted TIM-barrel fold metal-dependent hydrolase
MPDTSAKRIDIHHHFCPPDYHAAVGRHQPIVPILAGWSLQKSLDDMAAAGVAAAMLSITTPGFFWGDAAETRSLVRLCNDYGARLVADHPGKFGLFAALPLPDIDASLAEIAYALDTLGADGIGLFTDYQMKYLGDPAFGPVLDELNRRHCVVYTHPVCPECCRNLVPGIPEAAIEYGTDTTRTIASLVFSGAAARYRDIAFIFSHAGGTMPFLIERFDRLVRNPATRANLPHGVRHELARFHYDTAQVANPSTLGCLLRVVSVSQLLYGTDFPFRTAIEHVEGLAQCGFPPADLAAIERGNALELLPRLRS